MAEFSPDSILSHYRVRPRLVQAGWVKCTPRNIPGTTLFLMGNSSCSNPQLIRQARTQKSLWFQLARGAKTTIAPLIAPQFSGRTIPAVIIFDQLNMRLREQKGSTAQLSRNQTRSTGGANEVSRGKREAGFAPLAHAPGYLFPRRRRS